MSLEVLETLEKNSPEQNHLTWLRMIREGAKTIGVTVAADLLLGTVLKHYGYDLPTEAVTGFAAGMITYRLGRVSKESQ